MEERGISNRLEHQKLKFDVGDLFIYLFNSLYPAPINAKAPLLAVTTNIIQNEK